MVIFCWVKVVLSILSNVDFIYKWKPSKMKKSQSVILNTENLNDLVMLRFRLQEMHMRVPTSIILLFNFSNIAY